MGEQRTQIPPTFDLCNYAFHSRKSEGWKYQHLWSLTLLLIGCLPLGIKNALVVHPSAVFDTRKCHFSLSRPPLFPLPGSADKFSLTSAAPLGDLVWRVSMWSHALQPQHLPLPSSSPQLLSLLRPLISHHLVPQVLLCRTDHTHTYPAASSGHFQAAWFMFKRELIWFKRKQICLETCRFIF